MWMKKYTNLFSEPNARETYTRSQLFHTIFVMLHILSIPEHVRCKDLNIVVNDAVHYNLTLLYSYIIIYTSLKDLVRSTLASE